MNLAQAKKVVLDGIFVDIWRTGVPALVDPRSPDPTDARKFVLNGKPGGLSLASESCAAFITTACPAVITACPAKRREPPHRYATTAWAACSRMAASVVKRFLVIFEKGRNNHSACSPDLPGCIATGETRRQAAARIRQAIQMHLEGLREERLPIPRARVSAQFIEVP